MILTDLQSFSPTWRGFVPGMLPEDQTIWYDWLDKHQQHFDHLYYNVRLSTDPPTPKDVDPRYVKMWQDLSARRADVIAAKFNTLTLIEVASRIVPANLGRIEAYLELWKLNYPANTITRTIVIYERATPIDLRLLAARGHVLAQVTA